MPGSPRPYVTPVANPTVAQVLLAYLALEGVDRVFGVPGGGLANLLTEFKDRRDEFLYVIARQETGAAYLADGYFRATGKLGVVMVTSGPGATNALTGAMNAQAGGSAMLVLTGEVAENDFGKGYLQEGIDAGLDVNAIYTAATKSSAVLSDQSDVQTLLSQALRNALSIPRRAVHLSMPNNVAAEVIPRATLPKAPENYRAIPGGAAPDRVARVLDGLLAAKRPLIFLGSGCREPFRIEAVRSRFVAFVERHGIPVMTTPDGKGIFPENHPLSLRIYGAANCMWPQYWLDPKRLDPTGDPPPYDALLVLGTSLRELSTNSWNPMLVPAGPFYQVDLDQGVIGRGFNVSLGVVAEIGAFVESMAEPSPEPSPPPEEAESRKAWVARIKAEKSPFADPSQYGSTESPIRPAALVRILQEGIPASAMIFLDAGNCVGWGLHYFAIDPPGEIHSALAMGPMGFAVGAVVGAKMGRPDRTCVALVGDGAFLMQGAEVSTARHYGVGAIWVVLRDDDLSMVSQGQAHFFPDPKDPDVWDTLYRLGRPDLARYAEGLGADAYEVASPEELERLLPTVLERADREGRPQVIVAGIDASLVPPYYTPAYIPTPSPSPARAIR